MAADSKNAQAQSRLEKAAREAGQASVDYEVEAKLVREKTARLRALRLAKEAADNAARPVAAVSKKPARGGKKAAQPKGSLADWLADQTKSGRRT